MLNDTLKLYALHAPYNSPSEKDLTIASFFQTLCMKNYENENPPEIALCSLQGVLLSATTGFSSYLSLNLERLNDPISGIFISSPVNGYYLICEKAQSENPAFWYTFTQFEMLTNAFRDYASQTDRILNALDAAKKSISVYDKDARLLFANQYFCDYLYIPDRASVIGKPIEDIIKKIGTKIYSVDSNSHNLKMHDVLTKGEEVIDWEVRITSAKGESRTVGNDMYPVRNEKGDVEGMVEITHSRQQIIANARKYAGLSAEYTFDNIIGSSTPMRETVRMAKDYANSNLSLLVTGESGVGKELFAQSIHNYSGRSKGPFVALNCASFPENLIESELFGYVGGAFTGASKNGQMGKFELADGGTLFLDEVGELPLHFQSKLLRVLETWTVTRIGSGKQIPVNVRLISATNRDLAKMVDEGLFRQDLYYRLQILNIQIPPLRDRESDVLEVASALLMQAKDPESNEPKTLSEDSKKILLEYTWPGNVRELRNVLYRASILSKTDTITSDVLLASMSANSTMRNRLSASDSALDSTLSDEARLAERRKAVEEANIKLINEAIAIAGGNRSKAADLLGISRNTLYRNIDKYGIE